MTSYHCIHGKVSKYNVTIPALYSKTPIYRAHWGKGIRPGKSGSTVYRGTIYIDLHTKLVMGGGVKPNIRLLPTCRYV